MKFSSIIVYGSAIFAMFFGSGNLVFPLQIGLASGDHWFLAFLGLAISGIILPFLGLFVIKLHNGNYYNFFGQAGILAKHILPLFILSLLGCFGVVPRCITVAHGGFSYLYPNTSLFAFSLVFCALTFIFCLKDQRMISLVGKWLSPALISCLVILILLGIYLSPETINKITPVESFFEGFTTGYQLMDLFAAFFFSSLIFLQIQKELPHNISTKRLLRIAITPSIIGSTMLATVYLGFVYLGAHYSNIIANKDPEMMLPIIANHVMGLMATTFIAFAMVLSCLTTVVALTNIYARYLCNHIKGARYTWILATTIVISFIFSLMDFQGIAKFLVPILEVSYPGIILLTLLDIIAPKMHSTIKSSVFWGATIIMIGVTAFN
ncbi:MAG: branched-chain amino acid transport system II carrier protein [Myxococcales bacterium]|nr:branched-chain amino acid transport system II carrier protein [Myxococcales bacterium]USN50398.1 MAG: branched-chain amino acid transport system II carrier protein [Myxococcales bacterium]